MLGAKKIADHFLPPVTRNETSWAEVCRGGECDVGTGDCWRQKSGRGMLTTSAFPYFEKGKKVGSA